MRAVQVYLRQAPLLWAGLAERYPARAAWLEARARAAPAGELRDHTGRAIRAWLLEERAAVEKLAAEGLDAGELPGLLEAALASGITDPDLERRIEDGLPAPAVPGGGLP